MFVERLVEILKSKGVSGGKIDDVVDSGYIIRGFADPFSGRTWESVSDQMYGSKQFSSVFDIDDFIRYIHGENNFMRLPNFREYTVRNFEEIHAILSEEQRQQYIKEGRLSFRGQTQQHYFKRKVPNPVRSNDDGMELSIFPGIFRQKTDFYSFSVIPNETLTLRHLLHKLEPNPEVYIDSSYSYDVMKVEQHYATQTAGLDISFDIETAIFFATYKFKHDANNIAYYEKIRPGQHIGVIYGFCFRDPFVKRTEFLIKDFDLFKTYRPERIIRQDCGLPIFREYDRNIAITDLDFIINLHRDFDYQGNKTPEYMFPNTEEDKFYGKVLELKDQYPDLLKDIVEYKGSRA